MSEDDDRPLTVLVLNPMGEDGWGGVERWFMDVALGLVRRGHRVLSVGRPGALWTRRSLEAGLPTRTTAMKGDLALGEARAIAYWMQEERVEVLCTKLHRGIRLGGLAARFAGHVPVVAFMGLVEAKAGWRYRITYRMFLHWILTLSEGMRRDILAVKSGVPEDRVVAIPYGVDPGVYDVSTEEAQGARRMLGAGPGDLLVLAAGRLHEQKRFDLLLEAFARAREKVPAARLVVVGTGSLRADLERRARELGVADRTQFAGFRADMPAVFAAADLFALSSDDEGLPMVVLEAMAAGLPVVATEVGSVRDLVEDGETGIVVERRNPGSMGDGIASLLADEATRRRMGAAGRARVRERYRLDRCVEETEAFLRRVARGRS